MLDKDKTAMAFSKAAAKYDQYAGWQQKIARQLVSYVRNNPLHILDLGCGTGELAILLKQKIPQAEIHGIDIAPGMIEQAQARSVLENLPEINYKVCDIEQIDYPAESFDLVISNLSLQWLNDLDSCFREIKRVLKPQGVFLFSTIIAGSLPELTVSYQKTLGEYRQRHNFHEYSQIEKSLLNNSFAGIRLQEKTEQLYFEDFYTLVNSMRKIGGKAQGSKILTRKELARLADNYPENKQGLPLTYKIVFGEAGV